LTEHPAHPLYETRAVRFAYGSADVVKGLSVTVDEGGVTALVGPNGSGKSTLLKMLGRIHAPSSGAVILDGKAIASVPSKEVARRVGVLPQSPSAPEELTVRELVEQGRFPHAGALRMLRRQDHAAIDEALELTDITHLQHRPLDQLSGGERQRAWIALTLAQSTPVVLLDEPTTFLDIRHQLEVLHLIERLNREQGKTVIVVLHDLNQAAAYSTRMIAMQDGRIAADGVPHEVLTAELLSTVFGIEARIIDLPNENARICVPLGVAARGAAALSTLEQIDPAALQGASGGA